MYISNNRYKVKTPNGWSNFDGLQKVKRNSSLEFQFTNGETIECSPNHIFIRNGKEIYAKDLKCGDIIDSHNNEILKIFHIELNQDEIELYDLINVNNGNIYNTNSAISHNCEFLGSAGTLISGQKLKIMTHQNVIESRFDSCFRIYEYPQEEDIEEKIEPGRYIALFDTGEGVGGSGDFSVVHVLQIINKSKYKQVAVFHSNTISLVDYPLVIEKIASFYNSALIIGENNTIGKGVLNDLIYDLEYENIFFGDDAGNDYGIRMTGTSKRIGNSNLKLNIEDDYFEIVDLKTINEFTWYIRKGNTYCADKNKHDDLITPLVIFSYFLRNKNWVDNWLDIESMGRSNLSKNIEETLLPIGFTSTGEGVHEIGRNEEKNDIILPF